MLKKKLLLAAGILSTIWIVIEMSSCSQPICAEIVCHNSGVCRDGFCQCTDGWGGAECSVRLNSTFNGLYKGVFKPGANVAYIDSLIILEDTSTVDTFVMAFFFDIYQVVVEGQVIDENKFHFANDTVSTAPFYARIEGTGMLEGDKLTMYFLYEKEGEDSAMNCSFFGQRQFLGD